MTSLPTIKPLMTLAQRAIGSDGTGPFSPFKGIPGTGMRLGASEGKIFNVPVYRHCRPYMAFARKVYAGRTGPSAGACDR